MHYVDEGMVAIILPHGERWAIFSTFIRLSKANRVVVPDHMGFGKSETLDASIRKTT